MKKTCENCKWYMGENKQEAIARTRRAGYFEFTKTSFEGKQKITTGICRKTHHTLRVSYDDFCGEFKKKQ